MVKASVVWFPITTYLEVYCGAGVLGPALAAFGATVFGFLAPAAGGGIAAAGATGASSAAFAGAWANPVLLQGGMLPTGNCGVGTYFGWVPTVWVPIFTS